MLNPLTPVPFWPPGDDGTGRSGYPPAPEPLPVPVMDNHTHLDFPDAELLVGIKDALDAAAAVGVQGAVQVGCDLESSRFTVKAVDLDSRLLGAVALHPNDAPGYAQRGGLEDALAEIEALAGHPRVRAIGETGLDTDRGFSPLEAQLANLRRNLALAVASGKPAILHCRSKPGARDAQDLLVEELLAAGLGGHAAERSFGDRPAAIIHSYSGPIDYAETVLGLGLAISFSGLVFRVGEEASAEVARIVPADRLLVETDAPFLSPPGAPRKRNEPEWVAVTAGWLAEQRAEDPQTLGDGLVAAYDRVLGRNPERPRSVLGS